MRKTIQHSISAFKQEIGNGIFFFHNFGLLVNLRKKKSKQPKMNTADEYFLNLLKALNNLDLKSGEK